MTCDKEKHTSRNDAEEIIKHMHRAKARKGRIRAELKSYYCDRCQCWHISSRSKRAKRKRFKGEYHTNTKNIQIKKPFKGNSRLLIKNFNESNAQKQTKQA